MKINGSVNVPPYMPNQLTYVLLEVNIVLTLKNYSRSRVKKENLSRYKMAGRVIEEKCTLDLNKNVILVAK